MKTKLTLGSAKFATGGAGKEYKMYQQKQVNVITFFCDDAHKQTNTTRSLVNHYLNANDTKEQHSYVASS